jgi:hypothetical protein
METEGELCSQNPILGLFSELEEFSTSYRISLKYSSDIILLQDYMSQKT